MQHHEVLYEITTFGEKRGKKIQWKRDLPSMEDLMWWIFEWSGTRDRAKHYALILVF